MSCYYDRLEWLRKRSELLDSPYYTIRKAMIDDGLATEKNFILDLKISEIVNQIKHEKDKHGN